MYIHINKTAKPDLSPYKCETRQLTYIRSTDRLIQMDRDKLYHIEVKSGPDVKTILGARPVTLVQLDYIKGGEIFQVSPNASMEKIVKQIYKISPESLVEYVIETNPTETWFYIHIPAGQDLKHSTIRNEVLKWLEIVYGKKKDTL